MRIKGNFEVRDLQGDTVRSVEVDEFGLLPGGERIIRVEPDQSSPPEPGQYYAIAVMDFGGESLIQGGLPIEIQENRTESTE